MTYESTRDRENERRAMGVMRLWYPYSDWRVTETVCKWDLEARRDGKTVAIAEYKRRRCSIHRWLTLKIDKAKIDDCMAYAAEKNIGFALVIEWNEGFYQYAPKEGDTWPTSEWKTRAARGDTVDIVYEIPVASFKQIEAT